MKCLVCPAEIDEHKNFNVSDADSPSAKAMAHAEKLSLAETLSQWRHVSVMLNGAGQTTLLAGHVCPKHTDKDLATVTLSLGVKK